MILQLVVLIGVVAALAYLFYRQSKLAKEVKELRDASETYVTLDEWEATAQPKIEALEDSHVTTSRHLAMLAASVRALERRKPDSCELPSDVVEETPFPPFPEEDEEENLEDAATHAAHTEDQIQAMISSVANIFGMGRQRRETTDVQTAFAASLPSFVAGPTRLIISTPGSQSGRDTRPPIIEEEEEPDVDIGEETS
jgi:hypothetical protein